MLSLAPLMDQDSQHARRARSVASAVVAVALVAACGGGGSDSGAPPPPAGGSNGGSSGNGLPASSTLAQQCSAENSLAPANSRTSTLATERRWVRSYLNEAYLWYREVPTVSTADPLFNTASVPESLNNYFQALKTRATTASGKRKDEFSFTIPTAQFEAQSQGSGFGFGAEWILDNGAANPPRPRTVRIAFVDPGTPAANNGLGRGQSVISIDGVSIEDNTNAGLAALNEALFSPVNGRSYTFVVSTGAAQRSVTLSAQQITKTPVQNVRTISTPSGNVGYMTFNDHILPAEGQLVSAFQTLADANVSDLVLDLRYNGGGFIYIASQVGYMIAGATRTANKTFERFQFSDRRSSDTNNPNNNTPFFNVASGIDNTNTTKNAPLPTLNLGRVYVLASPGTCSASESIVNGLRGVGVTVVLVGGTTCGKPFGFTAKDNCGISYFPIEFQGVNDVGFGDYADGFAPTATCNVPDDLSRALGDSSEGMLAAALSHRVSGSCGGTSIGRESPQSRSAIFGSVIRHPVREGKYRR
jgi:carboxyl-terminal processing protease